MLAERGGLESGGAAFDSSEGSGREEPASRGRAPGRGGASAGLGGRGGLQVDVSSPTPGEGETRGAFSAGARESGGATPTAAQGSAGRRQLTALPRASTSTRKDDP